MTLPQGFVEKVSQNARLSTRRYQPARDGTRRDGVGNANPRWRGAVARQVVPVRRIVLQNSVGTSWSKEASSPPASVRHVAEDTWTGTSSMKHPMRRRKARMGRFFARRAASRRTRAAKPMGSTSVVRRLFHSLKELPPFGGAALQRPRRKASRIVARRIPFTGIRWKRSRSSASNESTRVTGCPW